MPIVNCLECNDDYNSKGFGHHIRTHNLTGEEYHIKHELTSPDCKICGEPTCRFISINEGYTVTCGKTCGALMRFQDDANMIAHCESQQKRWTEEECQKASKRTTDAFKSEDRITKQRAVWKKLSDELAKFKKTHEGLSQYEWRLWSNVEFKSLNPRKQVVVIGKYRVDFLIDNLVIELDGWSHLNPDVEESDKLRDSELQDAGYSILRINNSELMYIAEVMIKIKGSIPV